MPPNPLFPFGMLSWEQLAVPVLHGLAFWRMLRKHQGPQITESRNHLGWKKPLKSTFTQSLPCQRITLPAPISRQLWRVRNVNTSLLSSPISLYPKPRPPLRPCKLMLLPMLVLKGHLQTPSLPLPCFPSFLLHFPGLKGHFLQL